MDRIEGDHAALVEGEDVAQLAQTERLTARDTLARKKRELFLAELARGGSISRACRLSGLGRTTAREWRDRDDDFRREWDEAQEEGLDQLEDEVRDEGDWRAKVRMLETKRHDTWGTQRIKSENTNTTTATLAVEVTVPAFAAWLEGVAATDLPGVHPDAGQERPVLPAGVPASTT